MHGGRPITLQGDVAAADVLPYRLKTSLGAAILPGELGWRNRWAAAPVMGQEERLGYGASFQTI
jgi:hypothetical protein